MIKRENQLRENNSNSEYYYTPDLHKHRLSVCGPKRMKYFAKFKDFKRINNNSTQRTKKKKLSDLGFSH